MGSQPHSKNKAGAPGRGGSTRFKKGQSGNPGGRKRVDPELQAAFLADCEKARKVLVCIMGDKKAKDENRIKAAIAILDRGMGKPRQAIELAGPDGGPIPTEPRREPDPSFVEAVVAELRGAGLVSDGDGE